MRFYEFNTLINEDVGHIFLKFREQKAGPSGGILQAYWGSAGTAKELKYQGNQFRGIYSSKDLINKLGIDLYNGSNVYEITHYLNDDNYFNIYNGGNINYNLNPNGHFRL